MLDHYYRLAASVRKIRRILWILAALAVLVFVLALVPLYRGGGYAAALGAVTVLLWCLWLISVAHSFADAPPRPDPGAPFPARIRIRARRALAWLIALVMTALLGVVAVISLRALATIVRG